MSTAPMKIDLHALETALPHTDRDVQDSLTRSGDQPDWPGALHAVLALRGRSGIHAGLFGDFRGRAPQMPRTSQGGPEIIWRSSERMKDLFSAVCCPMKIPFMLPPGSVQCPKKAGQHDQLKWYMRSFGLEHSQQSRIQNHWQREHWLAVRPLCSPCQWFLFLKIAWLC